MRTGGVYLTPVGGHWRDLQRVVRARRRRCARRSTPRTRRCSPTSPPPTRRCSASPPTTSSALERYVEELGPLSDVAHVSDAHGLLGEGLPYGAGELDLDPVVRRLGELVPYIVAEINEPDPARSPDMKAGYRAVERALAAPARRARALRAARLPVDAFDWQAVRRPPRPRARRCSSCRSASAAGAC